MERLRGLAQVRNELVGTECTLAEAVESKERDFNVDDVLSDEIKSGFCSDGGHDQTIKIAHHVNGRIWLLTDSKQRLPQLRFVDARPRLGLGDEFTELHRVAQMQRVQLMKRPALGDLERRPDRDAYLQHGETHDDEELLRDFHVRGSR